MYIFLIYSYYNHNKNILFKTPYVRVKDPYVRVKDPYVRVKDPPPRTPLRNTLVETQLNTKYRMSPTINRLIITDTILVKEQYHELSLESHTMPVPTPTPPNIPDPPMPPLPFAIIE
jgi:hypothetical protein